MTTATEARQTYGPCLVKNLREAAFNPRRHFDDKQLADLVESIKAVGILTPLLVRPFGDEEGVFEIVGGARRFRAAKLAGLKEVPVIARNLSDHEALELAVIDNLQRADVHPLDEAEGYLALVKQLDPRYDASAIAHKVGKSTSYVYQRLKLAELIEPAKKAFWKDEMTAGHAVLIARLRPEDQKEVLSWYVDAVKYDLVGTRELARHIENGILVELSKAPWSKTDTELVPAAGPCTICPKRSSEAPELFSDIKKGDRCLDRQCFSSKLAAYFEGRKAEAAASGLPAVLVSPEYSCPPGVLKSDRWHRLTNKKKCDKIAKGVVYSGGDRGQIIDVCTGMRCPIHSGHMQFERDPKEAERQKVRDKKGKRERELNQILFKEAVLKAPGEISRKTLEGVAIVLGREYGFDVVDSVFDFRHDAKKIRKLTDLQLAQFITAHALTDGYGDVDKGIYGIAKAWGVDVGQIDIATKLRWASDDRLEKDRLKEKEKKGQKLASKAAVDALKAERGDDEEADSE